MRFLPGLISAILVVLIVSTWGSVSEASIPPLQPPTGSLPAITYYTNASSHYTITQSEWQSLFTNVYDNSSYVSYNWSKNVTQYLIIFDLSYTGLNPYGLQFVEALSTVGFPSVGNMTKAFNLTKNENSQINGFTNIQALDAQAYPGFSWSVPKGVSTTVQYEEWGALFVIVASIFALYFIFNRKK